ncbi:MAG: hypothetical protein SGJ20_09500 [Planctomycetota bacterium]|nr:hypothetical protein [Planctomycetota bacterium]
MKIYHPEQSKPNDLAVENSTGDSNVASIKDRCAEDLCEIESIVQRSLYLQRPPVKKAA